MWVEGEVQLRIKQRQLQRQLQSLEGLARHWAADMQRQPNAEKGCVGWSQAVGIIRGSQGRAGSKNSGGAARLQGAQRQPGGKARRDREERCLRGWVAGVGARGIAVKSEQGGRDDQLTAAPWALEKMRGSKLGAR